MKLLKKLDNPLNNLSFIALMAGINAIFALFASFVPLGALFIMIFLPLCSAFVALLCKPSYIFIYFFTALGLSFALSAWNFQNTLFYVVPSIIVGLFYGLSRAYKLPSSLTIFVLSLIYMGLVYGLLPLINLLYGTNPIEVLLTITNSKDNELVNNLIPAGIYVYALISSALPSFIIHNEFERFKVAFAPEKPFYFANIALGIIASIITLVLPFYNLSVAYLFFVFAIYFGVISILPIVALRSPYILLPLGALVIASIFIAASLYNTYPTNGGFCLYVLFATSLNISALISAIILTWRKKC